MRAPGKVTFGQPRLLRLAVVLSAAGCSPLVATIGYEDPSEASVTVPASDGLDATVPDEPDATQAQPDATLTDDAGVAPVDAARPVTCWHLPDVVNQRNEAGIERVEEGEVFGATDKALGCLDAGTSNDPVPVSYARKDGAPLVVGGQDFALAWTPGINATQMAWLAPERCEQPPLGTFYIIATALTPPCWDLPKATDAKVLRIVLSSQTLFPQGFRLCNTRCPVPPP